MKYLLIATGGAIGSLFRYLTIAAVTRLLPGVLFPWGTFAVNASGSFIIGFLWALSEAGAISAPMRFFLFAGLLGGFTTYSSFSVETINLFRHDETAMALSYVVLTNLICIACAFGGFAAVRLFAVK